MNRVAHVLVLSVLMVMLGMVIGGATSRALGMRLVDDQALQGCFGGSEDYCWPNPDCDYADYMCGDDLSDNAVCGFIKVVGMDCAGTGRKLYFHPEQCQPDFGNNYCSDPQVVEGVKCFQILKCRCTYVEQRTPQWKCETLGSFDPTTDTMTTSANCSYETN